MNARLCELPKFVGGHLGLGGTLTKALQQVPVLGHLAVPDATLDNELLTQNDADVCFNVYFRYGIVEPADA